MKKILLIALISGQSCFANEIATRTDRIKHFFATYSPVQFESIKDENSYIPGFKTTVHCNPKLTQAYFGLLSGLLASLIGLKCTEKLIDRFQYGQDHENAFIYGAIFLASAGTALAARKYTGNTFSIASLTGGIITALISLL